MHKRGFTLVEIVMATVILSVTMLGLIAVFVSAKRLIRHSRARMTAAEAGRLFLEDISWDCIENRNCPPANQSIANDTYDASYAIDRLNGNMSNVFRIKTTIHWKEND